MQNVVLLKSDLESDFAEAIYLSGAPGYTQIKGEVGNRGESTDHKAGSKIPT
jgi:hypothetical protein